MKILNYWNWLRSKVRHRCKFVSLFGVLGKHLYLSKTKLKLASKVLRYLYWYNAESMLEKGSYLIG